MSTTSSTSSTSTPTSLAISGLASGFDWQSLVTQLIQVERAPETTLRTTQSTLQQKNNVYSSMATQLGTLNNAINTLKDPTLYDSRQATVSDSTIGTATAANASSLGSYTFNITQLASNAVQQGGLAASKPLAPTSDVGSLVLSNAGFASAITAGNFTVNGKTVTIATSDTLQSAFDKISAATGGSVAGSYDATTDQISLNSSSPIVLGSATDSSNFLQAAKLYNNGDGIITSTSELGGVSLTSKMSASNLATDITDGGSGAGQFLVNGVAINYNTANDSVNDVLSRINASTAGVTASYDSINDRFVLTDKSAGDVGISLQDVTGNFLSATNLSSGTLQRGKNLQYNINGGGTITSLSNTITQDSSGLTGLSVTALKIGAVTVGVNSDTAKIQSAITNFVSQYNAAQSFINSQTASSTDSTGKVTAGLLTGDSDATGIQSQLRHLANATLSGLSGSISNLDGLGIVSNGNDNSLSVADTTKLANALTNNLSSVKDLFTNTTNGLGTTVSTYLNSLIGDDGSFATKQKNFTSQSTDIDNTIAAMERKILDDQSRMNDEFAAMETAQASINQQQAYLTKTFP